MPPIPTRIDSARCGAAFGAGSVCLDPANAVRLAALLDVLSGVYLDRASCETGSP